MKLAQERAIPGSKPLRAPVAVLTAFFLCSCAGPRAANTDAAAGIPAVSAQASPASVPAGDRAKAAAHNGSILSTWERGRCALENGRTVSYSENGEPKQHSLRLDSDPRGALEILCSQDYTVIMSGERAVVALGASGIIEGYGMLGSIGGRFVPANSYEVSLKALIAEEGGIASSKLEGGTLTVTGRSGKRWSMDLANPQFGWKVY